ncbi:N(G),N(G)-dimethylarginine dimethylaminohydrolase [candidate division KSB1 bacterium]|nr:N(G),N(G)-dimethylarginine dimethylaminohydrolase [candidate division KSB1 bacterium]
MKKYSHAIVRIPCREMIHGLTTANLGKPDYDKALEQHQAYIDALKQCGLEVLVLDPDNRYPDSTFVEDTALLTTRGAIITNPGAPSRKGETDEMQTVLGQYFEDIKKIQTPGTLDAGDVLMAESHFYIGLSSRTNFEGAKQLIQILTQFGFSASTIPVNEGLHLKSGVAYLNNNYLAINSDVMTSPEFQKYSLIKVIDPESYAANCLWINDKVLVASGFPVTKEAIEKAGFETVELDVSEFRKLDGGLSCLSLRFW